MEENDVFKLTVRYESEVLSSEKTGLTENIRHADKIMALIADNPKITAKEIGNILSLSENHVRKILVKLESVSLIERRGSRKVGEWMVL